MHALHDKGHGRIEQRSVTVVREVDWLSGERRFPGELRLPGVACIVRVQASIERGGKPHTETRYYTRRRLRRLVCARGWWGGRAPNQDSIPVGASAGWYYISSAVLDAERAGHAVRGHWGIENRLHWVLVVTFNDDQSRLRKGFGAKNMAVTRHFALNLVRSVNDKKSIKLRRKMAGWTTDYLQRVLNERVG